MVCTERRTFGKGDFRKNVLLFGKYLVEGVLGRGRQGTVYLARHTVLNELRAIKRVSRDNPGALREAELLGSIRHPGVPILYDVETDSKYHYLVMEYLPGETLSARMEQEGFLETEVLSLGVELCRILIMLHTFRQVPVLYLDLQPENVMICGGRLKLLDFGSAMTPEMTARERIRFGTPAFAAPEQKNGGSLDVRTDVYGLGAVLHYMCSGEPPGKGSGGFGKPFQGRQKVRLGDIIRSCLMEQKEDRPESIGKVLGELTVLSAEMKSRNGRSLRIAVCGSRTGIGVTRMCLETAEYAASAGLACVLEETRAGGDLEKMAENGYGPDDSGVYRAGRYRIRPAYGNLVKIQVPDCDMLVADCGDRLDAAAGSGADMHLLLCGTEVWDTERTEEAIRFMSQCRDVSVLFRGALESWKPVLPEKLINIPYFRLPEGMGKTGKRQRRAVMDELFRRRLENNGKTLPALRTGIVREGLLWRLIGR